MQRNTRDSFAFRRSLLPLVAVALTLIASVASGQDPSQGPSVPPAELIDGSVNPDAAPAEAKDPETGLSFLNLLTRGGWFMVPLGLLSLLVVTIGFERTLFLRREKLFPKQLVNKLALLSRLEGGLDPRKAYQTCQEYPSSASTIIRAALTRVGRPLSEIENAVEESSQREANRLASLGSWLTLAAAVAPLVGLLGTVWGITQAFYDTTQLVEGQNRAEALAQGIYTALVTTMCGLLIAIPAAILAHYFENKIVATINQIQEMIFSLLPQFERYEGQLRFTADAAAESSTVGLAGNDAPGNGSDREATSRKSQVRGSFDSGDEALARPSSKPR